MFIHGNGISTKYIAELSETCNCQNEMLTQQKCCFIIMVMKFSFAQKYMRNNLHTQIFFVAMFWHTDKVLVPYAHDTSL